jgi:hypothetical protein
MADHVLTHAEVTFTNLPGCRESEFEDMIDLGFYRARFIGLFGVDVKCNAFRKTKAKWSGRLESAFVESGKMWNETVKKSAKHELSVLVQANPDKALSREGPFTALRTTLEQKIKSAQ